MSSFQKFARTGHLGLGPSIETRAPKSMKPYRQNTKNKRHLKKGENQAQITNFGPLVKSYFGALVSALGTFAN